MHSSEKPIASSLHGWNAKGSGCLLYTSYEDVTEKLSVLCLMHGEIDNFFKYNKECEHPLEEDMILDLLNSPEPVSYTHLDVYKRQILPHVSFNPTVRLKISLSGVDSLSILK